MDLIFNFLIELYELGFIFYKHNNLNVDGLYFNEINGCNPN
jgi:hypothetical protein